MDCPDYYNVKMWQPATKSYRPQVVLQDVAEQVEQPAPPADVFPIFPPKTDIILSTFFDLHEGQAISNFSLLDLNNISKRFWHFLHLNSYIGIVFSTVYRWVKSK
jgi:hypothetical protein